MEIEVNRVVQSDDAAWEEVEAARSEAEKILIDARQFAQSIVSEKESELASDIHAEQEKTLAEAQSKARDIMAEADLYIERVRVKVEASSYELVNRLASMVTTV